MVRDATRSSPPTHGDSDHEFASGSDRHGGQLSLLNSFAASELYTYHGNLAFCDKAMALNFNAMAKTNKTGMLVVFQLLLTSVAMIVATYGGGGSNMAFLIALALMVVLYLITYFLLFPGYIKPVLKMPDKMRACNIPGSTPKKPKARMVHIERNNNNAPVRHFFFRPEARGFHHLVPIEDGTLNQEPHVKPMP